MSTLEEIESAISNLQQDQLAAFRAWFVRFDSEMWDKQFETDVAAGRLDKLADEALRDLDQGRCTPL